MFLTPEKGGSLKSTDQLYQITRGAGTILNAADTLQETCHVTVM